MFEITNDHYNIDYCCIALSYIKTKFTIFLLNQSFQNIQYHLKHDISHLLNFICLFKNDTMIE